jgi:hypothetical protein
MSYRVNNRAKVKNDGSGINPNTFDPLSLLKAVLKAAAREVSNGSDSDLGGRLSNVRYHPDSGPNLAEPLRLISADCVEELPFGGATAWFGLGLTWWRSPIARQIAGTGCGIGMSLASFLRF